MLIDWVIQPVGLIAFMLILALVSWCIAGMKPHIPFFLFCTSTVLFFCFSMPSVANALVLHLENTRQNAAECSKLDDAPLVVLGGGIDLYVPNDSPYETLNNDSLIRVLRAPDFADVDTQYYLLGGGSAQRTLAVAMRQVLIDRGIDAGKITVETNSTSTHENAMALIPLLPPSETVTIKLLTSMLHVSRAAATFEKQGYSVCHIGVDTLYSIPKPPISYLPYLSGLTKSSLALREWIAMRVYRIKGYV